MKVKLLKQKIRKFKTKSVSIQDGNKKFKIFEVIFDKERKACYILTY
jgi:hypothetical protein